MTSQDKPENTESKHRPVSPTGSSRSLSSLKELLSQEIPEFDVNIKLERDEVILSVKPEDIEEICTIARSSVSIDCDYLRCLSVVDYGDNLEVNYHLFSLTKRHKLLIKCSVIAENPVIPSVTSVWRGADWFEREGHDLFGVEFVGHPNLSPLLLYEGFEGHPGLKSYPFHDYEEW